MEATWWTQPEQLDEEQKAVVALPLDADHLIIGPPGSGKTNLLILRATYLHNAKIRDTVVLTFGRVLREFLATGATNYPFSDDKIQTYVRWATSILREHGREVNDEGDLQEVRARILAELQDLLEQGAAEVLYDCILIDEAQDYSPEEIRVIQAFAKRVFAVGDDRQRIFRQEGALATLGNFCKVSNLKYHYRNGIKICRVADGVRAMLDDPKGLEASTQYDEVAYPSSVRDHGGLTIAQQVEVAVKEIKTQLRAYPDGIVGVLCPRHEELSEVISLLESSEIGSQVQVQRHADGYNNFDSDRRVIVTTLHSAKGLEFRTLHLLGMDKISRFQGAQKRMAYTGVTRAKTSLAIYHKDSLPGYFEKGLVSLEPTAELPSLDTLFSG